MLPVNFDKVLMQPVGNIVTLRAIGKGEELTWDYKYSEAGLKAMLSGPQPDDHNYFVREKGLAEHFNGSSFPFIGYRCIACGETVGFNLKTHVKKRKNKRKSLEYQMKQHLGLNASWEKPFLESAQARSEKRRKFQNDVIRATRFTRSLLSKKPVK